MIDKSVLIALRDDDKLVLKTIYLEHKHAFLNFARSFNISNEDSLDIYQDAIMALRENGLKGHLNSVKSGLKTYLFSIGKYMIYKRLRENKKLHLVDSMKETNDFDEININDIDYNFNERQKQLQIAFNSLGTQCQSLLNLFYLRGFTLDEIVKELNYNNKDVAKSQKSRCLKSLKKIINS